MTNVWNADKPADSDVVSNFPTDSPANLLLPLNDAIGREHTFPGTYGTTAGRHASMVLSNSDLCYIIMQLLSGTLPTSGFAWIAEVAALKLGGYQDAEGTLLGLLELKWNGDVCIAGELQGRMDNIIPPGTKAFFVQDAVPTGWTRVTDYDDKILRIVSTVSDGGSTGGSWTISGCEVQLGGAHTHDFSGVTEAESVSYSIAWPASQATATYLYHTHTYSGTTAEEDTGGHAHEIDADGEWRPSYMDTILGQKSA
jgi:hypothetical protein